MKDNFLLFGGGGALYKKERENSIIKLIICWQLHYKDLQTLILSLTYHFADNCNCN